MTVGVAVVEFERVGELVAHGHDISGRPDAVEFRARANQPVFDRLAEVVVTVDRWGGADWAAQLLEDDDATSTEVWALVARSMPLAKAEALYVRADSPIRLVFSEYVGLQPTARYRIYLPSAVVTRPTIVIRGVQCARDVLPSRRKGWARARARA